MEEAFAIVTKDSVDLAIVQGVLEVLVLCVMIKVVIEAGVVDSVYVDVAMSAGEGFSEERVMSLGIGSMGRVEVLLLVTGFRDSQSLLDPINGGVGDTEPGVQG